jgi:putative transposase
VDGKKLKSINHWFNKTKAKLQSIADKQEIKGTTRRLAHLTMKRDHQVRDYMNKTARTIVNYCLNNQIGKLVVGYNPEWKHESNMGKRNNQQFVQIPHGSLRLKLQAICERYGIQLLNKKKPTHQKQAS